MEEIIMAELTAKQRKECLYAQQGELDAVLMYQELAKVVKDPKDAETFKQLAAEEGRVGFFKALRVLKILYIL